MKVGQLILCNNNLNMLFYLKIMLLKRQYKKNIIYFVKLNNINPNSRFN